MTNYRDEGTTGAEVAREAALAELSRAESYSRTVTVKYYWPGGESSTELYSWVDGERSRIRIQLDADSENILVDGSTLYYTVASVEVSDCLRGDLAAGDTYNVLYAGAPGRMTTSISGDLENLDVGSEAVFMPRIATPDTGWSSGDDYFCYADLAELYMDEGRRFLFLDTGDGVSYAAEVYDIPAADGETVTLDDVTAYLRGLLEQ